MLLSGIIVVGTVARGIMSVCSWLDLIESSVGFVSTWLVLLLFLWELVAVVADGATKIVLGTSLTGGT